jgi:hypothetical protein
MTAPVLMPATRSPEPLEGRYHCHGCQAATTWTLRRRRARCEGCGDPFPCVQPCGHADCAQARLGGAS